MKKSRTKRARHARWIALRTQGRPNLGRAWAIPVRYPAFVPAPAPGPDHDPITAIEEADRVF